MKTKILKVKQNNTERKASERLRKIMMKAFKDAEKHLSDGDSASSLFSFNI